MSAAQLIVKSRQDAVLEHKLNQALVSHSACFGNLDCIFSSQPLVEKFKELSRVTQAHESFAVQCLYSGYQVILGDLKIEIPSFVYFLIRFRL